MMTPSPDSSKAGEPTSARLVATLSMAGLLSGLIIVSVFEATLPTISTYKAKVLREAVFKVLPGANTLDRLVFQDNRLVSLSREEKGQEAVFGGYSADGKLVGYAIPGSGPGFQDTIRLLYGYLPDQRKVVGMEILESRETPGLGDKIYKDSEFVASFGNLPVDPEIVAVKKGKKSRPNEIDAITGATISSKAVVRIINQANERWLPRMKSMSEADRHGQDENPEEATRSQDPGTG